MTKKCWLAVDSNGDEKMTANTLGFIRFNPMLARKGDYMENRKIFSFSDYKKDYELWIESHEGQPDCKYGFPKGEIILPEGSIEKLIGRKLTWDDEPVLYEGNK